MNSCHNAEVVKALLTEFDKEVISEVLNDFWESWITNERNDCTTAEHRTNCWFVYHHLLKFLESIEQK